MADIALSAIQTLFNALQSPEVRDILFKWRRQSELERLEETVSTIKDFLLDLGSMDSKLSIEQEGYIKKLKDAIYDADDLIDEIRTKAQLKKLNKRSELFAKVNSFFSSVNSMIFANTSQKVEVITKKLDVIANNHAKYGFKFDCLPVRRRVEETCSLVYSPHVIGRDDDVEAIVGWVLDGTGADEGNTIDFLTIVGIKGLGKTTLAQLVYNDSRISSAFEFKLWVCVADQGENGFVLKTILSKILESAGHKLDDGSSMDMVRNLYQDKLQGKKCLLVLDDVWTEDYLKWEKLQGFFMKLGVGSKIIATSRSKETARIIGNRNVSTYELANLSEEHSWILFQLAAFGESDRHADLPELLEIGKKLVKQCCNVPEVIKVVGSLLFGQEINKWRAFEQNGLDKVSQGEDKIMSLFKFSYDNLASSPKACFSYCAIFPKDFEIQVQMLIGLWLAQGYISPFYEGQSMTDAGNDLFSALLQRCFFKDIKMDAYGEAESCKMHDFMHDIAQEGARKEICVANFVSSTEDHKMRHLFGLPTNYYFAKSKIRSYLNADASLFFREFNPKDHVCLRALSFGPWFGKIVPDSLCKLLHLRYLSLKGFAELTTLPKSIVKLHNLQTLILAGCMCLRKLPHDLSKLVNLRHLDISDCCGLSYMPKGMDRLTCLEVLTDFYVAKLDGSSNGKHKIGQLKDLKAMQNLKGGILIRFLGNHYINDDEGGYLCSKRLKKVAIIFSGGNATMSVDHEASLEKLKPHPHVKEFVLKGYHGEIISRWGKPEDNWATLFANLVEIHMDFCYELKHLPLLSALQYLRSLNLRRLEKVEYMEEHSCTRSTYPVVASSLQGAVAQVPFFPSLEYLEIVGMNNLKGWWRSISGQYDGNVDIENGSGNIDSEWEPPSFSRLKTLIISGCSNLISFPFFPAVETLEFADMNEGLQIATRRGNDSNLVNLREVRARRVSDLRSLPPCNPTAICISSSYGMETFVGVDEVFRTHGCRDLTLKGCEDLRSLSGGGFRHLTALESISIVHCPRLILNDDDNNDGIPWTSLHHTLRSFHVSPSNMESLPTGMQYLTSLQHLSLECCVNLQELPEWISCLSSLRTLTMSYCENIKSLPDAMVHLISLQRLQIQYSSKELEERCSKDPEGEDWSKIQHIPDITISL